MASHKGSTVISQPLPSAGELAWIWLTAVANPAAAASIRLVHGDDTIHQIECPSLESVYLGRRFTALCKPGMELQVFTHGSAAAVSRCETRFGFAARSQRADEVVEKICHHTHGKGGGGLLSFKPRNQRPAFITVAYRCTAGPSSSGSLKLQITKQGSLPQNELLCTLQPDQYAAGVYDAPPSVLAAISPRSTIACMYSEDDRFAALNLHIEIGYLPNYHRAAFQSMLHDKTFADLTLIAEDGTCFPVHKAMLAVRSPVFRSMFCGGMREASETEVHLDDIQGLVLEKVLQFIYTGELEDAQLAPLVDSLAMAASRLQIEDLVAVCSEFMAAGLDTDNVLSIFQLADTYDFADLRAAAQRFIVDNIEAIRCYDDYYLLPETQRAEFERLANAL